MPRMRSQDRLEHLLFVEANLKTIMAMSSEIKAANPHMCTENIRDYVIGALKEEQKLRSNTANRITGSNDIREDQ